jgi:hypothetical protein
MRVEMRRVLGGFYDVPPCGPEGVALRDKAKGKLPGSDDDGIHMREARKSGSEKTLKTKESRAIDFEEAPDTLQLGKSIFVYFSPGLIVETMAVDLRHKDFDFLDTSRKPWTTPDTRKSAHIVAIYSESETAVEETSPAHNGKSFGH